MIGIAYKDIKEEACTCRGGRPAWRSCMWIGNHVKKLASVMYGGKG